MSHSKCDYPRYVKLATVSRGLSDEDLQAVAEYLYDTDMNLPAWYKEHYKEEHGEEPKH